jgi:hypothetical protein
VEKLKLFDPFMLDQENEEKYLPTIDELEPKY